MIETKCAICGEGEFTVLYEANFERESLGPEHFSARHNPNHIHHRFVRCNECGLIYSNPVLEPEILAGFYRESDFLYEKDLNNLKETYGYYLSRYMAEAPSRGSLLEVGCGNGFFLEKALGLGFQKVAGVEPSLPAVNAASPGIRQLIIEDIFKPEHFRSESFDVVCFFQTLDHISRPNQFLADCRKLLKPGGIIYSIHHDAKSLGARIFGESWAIFDIQHTCLYDRETTARLFEKNGFKTISVFPAKNRFSIAHLVKLSPLPKGFKTFLTKIVALLGLSQVTLRLNAGNIGIVAQKV